ncbi:MAG: hypothetical protein L6R42_002177 [Xanthoria sp. 1 TBL-2021]|nr:MAG: hypothetical protein L6R42_002177 [Xanthoria sp. 1 TBL-2021]
MEADDDDDIYASGGTDGIAQATDTSGLATTSQQVENGQKPADLEEGEEEDEDEEEESDSDIDIITERKDQPKPEPIAPVSRISAIRAPLGRTSSVSGDAKPPHSPAIKLESGGKATPTPSKPGTSYPGVRTSSIDVDAKPIHGPTGKPITEKLIQAYIDFSEDDKPWRRPGTDLTDFFNYGFDEFTWASYCLKQDTLRKEVTGTKKQMEDMQNFMNMPGGMPPMPGMPTAPGGQSAVPPMPGMEGIPPELQQMMQQMISQGMDPTQISPEMMMQMMTGQGGGSGNPPQGQGQNFGGGQNFGPQNQTQGFGYGGGGGRGGRGGRRW